LTQERKSTIATALSDYFDEPLTIDINIGAGIGETPVQAENRQSDERYEAAKASLESDPNVKTLQNMFGAELKTESIEPINRSQSD
jgi:DNA polymerase-3 subunit gamma/tau